MKMELALYQALRAINVPEPNVNAVIQALESDMHTLLATKSDIRVLEHRFTSDISTLEHRLTAEIAKADLSLTIRMGVMLSATIGIMIAAMKFIH